MAKILIIVAQQNFRDEELNEPRRLLRAAGHVLVIASVNAGICKGMLGMDVTAELSASEARQRVEYFDMVVMVGGSGASALADDKDVIELLRKAKAQDKLMGAICIAPTVFAKAGVLEGKKATVYKTPEAIKILQQGKAIYIPQRVVVDGKLITADGPQSATEFGRELVKLLQK